VATIPASVVKDGKDGIFGGTSLHDIRWGDVAFAKEGCNERNDVILVCEICPIFNHGIYHDMMGIMMI
jgi:hypothetical protein